MTAGGCLHIFILAASIGATQFSPSIYFLMKCLTFLYCISLFFCKGDCEKKKEAKGIAISDIVIGICALLLLL
jgi:hypothetical protein